MKKPFKFIIILLVILFLVTIGKDMLIKKAVETGAQMVTGLRLDIRHFSLGLFSSHVSIKGLTLYNPSGYEERIMLDLPEVTVDYRLTSLFKGIIHIESFILNLRSFNVVKNKDGELNLNALKVVQKGKEKKEEPKKEKPEEPKEKAKAMKLQIDYLKIKFGTISFMDYSKATPAIKNIKINIDEEHANISNPHVIIALILNKAFLKASVSGLTGFDLSGIKGSVSNVVGDVDKLASQTVESAKALAGDAAQTAKDMGKEAEKIGSQAIDSAKETAGALKDTAKSLTEKIKLPFGK